jgi:hypothetical protein
VSASFWQGDRGRWHIAAIPWSAIVGRPLALPGRGQSNPPRRPWLQIVLSNPDATGLVSAVFQLMIETSLIVAMGIPPRKAIEPMRQSNWRHAAQALRKPAD